MQCTLCNGEIFRSKKVRPNVATFECGHEFHLSCVISYCKERYTDACPHCYKNVEPFINISTNRLQAIETLVAARRRHRTEEQKLKPSITSWFSTSTPTSLCQSIKNGVSLNTLRVKGYLPEDFIENQLSWNTLARVYDVAALLDFGCKWHHMILMNFRPEDFKSLSWQQIYDHLNIRASDLLQTNINIRQLSELNFSIQHIKQLGFTWNDFVAMGGNVDTLQLLTKNISDLKTYFKVSNTDLQKVGFTATNMVSTKWETDEFTPMKQKRSINIKHMRMTPTKSVPKLTFF